MKFRSLLKLARKFLCREEMPCSIYESFEKYPSFLKGRFQGGGEKIFHIFSKISTLLKVRYGFLFIVTMRSSVGGARRIANHMAEKNTPSFL